MDDFWNKLQEEMIIASVQIQITFFMIYFLIYFSIPINQRYQIKNL